MAWLAALEVVANLLLDLHVYAMHSVTNQSRALGYLLVHFMPDTNALYYDLVLSNVCGPTVAELHEGDASAVSSARPSFGLLCLLCQHA